MREWSKTLEIRSSPHIVSGHSVDAIMFNVVLALLPVTAFALYAWGLAALLILAVAVSSCVATEHLLCRLAGRETTIGDWSAVVTGLLYGLVLPPGLALWMVAVGGVAAVGVGKTLFGGLGFNPFNPALVGRALLQAAFPVPMTSWPVMPDDRFATVPSSLLAAPLAEPAYDAVSQATPLASWKFDREMTDPGDLLLGLIGGSMGETSALLILSGGLYLIARRMMSWRIPAAILLTVALFSGLLELADPERHAGPVFMLFSGGLMLGAMFMATDTVGSPMTHLACILYGALIGVLVVVIRVWGGMPEGVMYAILIGNALTPHFDRWFQPRVFGTQPGTTKNPESP